MNCPMCKKPAIQAYKPFCSKRCCDLDLGKWLIGGYVMANNDETESSEQETLEE